jgi:hypothetical protein
LRRYWFRFVDPKPHGLGLGCGVTAFGYDDAVGILAQTVFRGQEVPETREVIEDVDVSTLDRGHVLPNMEPPSQRGVWFPKGFPLPGR